LLVLLEDGSGLFEVDVVELCVELDL